MSSACVEASQMIVFRSKVQAINGNFFVLGAQGAYWNPPVGSAMLGFEREAVVSTAG